LAKDIKQRNASVILEICESKIYEIEFVKEDGSNYELEDSLPLL